MYEDDGKFCLEGHQDPRGPPSLPDGVLDDSWQEDGHQLHGLKHLCVFSQQFQWRKWQEQQSNCVTTTTLYI